MSNFNKLSTEGCHTINIHVQFQQTRAFIVSHAPKHNGRIRHTIDMFFRVLVLEAAYHPDVGGDEVVHFVLVKIPEVSIQDGLDEPVL